MGNRLAWVVYFVVIGLLLYGMLLGMFYQWPGWLWGVFLVSGLIVTGMGPLFIPSRRASRASVERLAVDWSAVDRRVFLLVGAGLSNDRIAEILEMSESAVRNRVSVLYQVFEVAPGDGYIEQRRRLVEAINSWLDGV